MVIIENKQDPVLSSILRRVDQIIPTQYLTYMRVHISCSHMGPGADNGIVYGVFILITLHFYIGKSCHRLVILLQSFR